MKIDKLFMKKVKYNCTAYDINVSTPTGIIRFIIIELYLDFKIFGFLKKQQDEKIKNINRKYSYLCCVFTTNFTKKLSYKSFFTRNKYLTKNRALTGLTTKLKKSYICNAICAKLKLVETDVLIKVNKIKPVKIILNNFELISLICRILEEEHHYIDIDTMLEIRNTFINCELENYVEVS